MSDRLLPSCLAVVLGVVVAFLLVEDALDFIAGVAYCFFANLAIRRYAS